MLLAILLYLAIFIGGAIFIVYQIAFCIFVFRFFRHGCIFFDNANYYMSYLIDKDKEISNKKEGN